MTGWRWMAGLTALALMGGVAMPRLLAHELPPTVEPPAPMPAAVSTGPVTIGVELDREAVLQHQSTERFLTVTLTPEHIGTRSVAQPKHVAIVVDTSGSMGSEGKIENARHAVNKVIDALAPTDTYTLVGFANHAQVLTPHTLAGSARRGAINALVPTGGTNVYAGLQTGIEQVRAHRAEGANRVILVSDGLTNAGITDPAAIARLGNMAQTQGITVSTAGVGIDFDEDLLASISDASGGTYTFVSDPSTLTEAFAKELQRTESITAQRTSVDLVFAEGVTPVEVVGWPASITDSGYNVQVGELYGGEPRKIVVRVKVEGSRVGNMPLVTASAHYLDMRTERPALASVSQHIQVTESVAEVDASVNVPALQHATAAFSNAFLDRSTRSYASGKQEQAQKDLAEGTELLNELKAMGYLSADLEEDLADFEAQAEVYTNAAPSSREGRNAVKMGKEKYRARAR